MGEGLLLELTSTHPRQCAAGTTKIRKREHFAIDSAASRRAKGTAFAGHSSTDTRVGRS